MAQHRTEEFKITGEDIMAKLKNLVLEGNVRKITIRDKEEKTIAEFPLTVGVVGVVFVPVLAAVGAIVALASECSIAVEKEAEEPKVKDSKSKRKD